MVNESVVGRVKKVDYGMWGSVVLKVVKIGGEVVVDVNGNERRWGRLRDVCGDIGRKMKVNLDNVKMKEVLKCFVEERRYMRDDVLVVEDWVVV